MNRLKEPLNDLDDSTLVRRLKRGDHLAFETLYARYASRVYRQALQMLNNTYEAEEVLQEVFISVYKKINQFRGAAAFTTWLFRLTANAAITKLRKRKRSREVNLDDFLPQFTDSEHHTTEIVDWSQDLEKNLSDVQMQQVVTQMLDDLQPIDKAVVVLSDLEGVSNKEIAKTLKLTLPAVKARLHRARLVLRGRLAEYFKSDSA